MPIWDKNDELSLSDALAVRAAIVRDQLLTFTVVSGSMEPLIMTNSKIVVAPIDSIDDLRVFDILLFWNGKVLVCHYLWHINSLTNADGTRTVVTRPLASRHGEDLPIPENHILGKIVSHKISFWAKLRIIFRKRSKDMRSGVLS